jgi:hypothetical protein
VGVGDTEFEVAFPEQPPQLAAGKLVAYNAGVSAGKTKLLLYTYLGAPVSSAVVIKVQISKVRKGRYGLEAIAKIPKVAGGYGSLTSISLKLDREFMLRDQPKSYLLAKCPDGQLLTKGTGVFSDGSRLSGTVARTCRPKGR